MSGLCVISVTAPENSLITADQPVALIYIVDLIKLQ